MRNISSPWFKKSLVFGSLALGAAPLAVAQQGSSIGFVDRQVLNAPAETHWTDPSANPLRSGGSTSSTGNSLRFTSPRGMSTHEQVPQQLPHDDSYGMPMAEQAPQFAKPSFAPRADEQVAPASFTERSSSRGLQLRSHKPQTGILSGILGETQKSTPSAARNDLPMPEDMPGNLPSLRSSTPPTRTAMNAVSLAPQSAPHSPSMPQRMPAGLASRPISTPSFAASQETPPQPMPTPVKKRSMWPKFMTNATKFPSLNATGLLPSPNSKPEPVATAGPSRAGSVLHAQPNDRAVQAAYQSAASAQTYAPPSTIPPRTQGGMLGTALPSFSRGPKTLPTQRGTAQTNSLPGRGPAAQSMPRATNPQQYAASQPNASRPTAQPSMAARQTASRQAAPQRDAVRLAAATSINAPANSGHGGQSAQGAQSATTLALARAHEASATAKTEAEFSEILATCQRIRADNATPEERAFGRQLAAWALNRRGQILAGAGRAEEATADFDTAVRLDADCWRAIHNRGVLAAQAGQLEAAFDDFQRTTELNPNYAKAYSNRAALYVLAGELEPALADYRRAAELDPKLAIAHRGCGRTCHMLGQMNEALEHFDTAAELTPNDASTLAGRGDLLTDLGYYADAAADYDRAIAANAKSAEAYRSSAWLLATCPDETVRNPELALRRAESASQLERKPSAMTYDTLAAAQASVGDFGSAVSTIRQAIQLASPSERGAYQDRMQLYQQSTVYTISPVGDVQQAGFER